jgi:hypothetical protein
LHSFWCKSQASILAEVENGPDFNVCGPLENRLDENGDVVAYITRYVRHPPIGETRILEYDGQTVTFSYKTYKHGRVT